MIEHLVTPLPFFRAVKQIFLFYFHVFKHIFGLVVLAALIQAIVPSITPGNPTVGLAIEILFTLVLMFFYAWILYHADTILMGRSETIRDALRVAKKRFLYVLGVLAVFIILGIFLSLFVFALHLLGTLLHADVLMFVISAIIVMFIAVLLSFAFPATIIDGTPIWHSFEVSARIVWGHWWRVFGIMVIFLVPMIILSLGILLIPSRNLVLVTIYEFIYHIIAYPVFIAVSLVLYHDLKMRRQMTIFRKVND